MRPTSRRGFLKSAIGITWSAIPVSKWVGTPIYEPKKGHLEGVPQAQGIGDLRSPWLLTIISFLGLEIGITWMSQEG